MNATTIAMIAAAAIAISGALHARELTVKECQDQFVTATNAGDLKKTTWADFRKAHCPSAPAADPRVQKDDKGAKK
jgi:hypothetical protein